MSKYEKVIPELIMCLTVFETYYKESTPYNVYVNDDEGWLSVYGIPKQTILIDSEDEETGICENNSITNIENTSLYWDRYVSSYHYKLLIKCYFTKLFVGKDPIRLCDGNSLLMKNMNGTYTYIGDRIYNFSVPSDDTIIDLYSPIHNYNSYPIAIGKKNVYLLLHGVYIEKENIDLEEDKLYDTYINFYYKHNYSSSNKIFKLFENIKRIDNGYYFQIDDLLENSIIIKKNINYYNDIDYNKFIIDYDIDYNKFIIDQVQETEKYKQLFNSLYFEDGINKENNEFLKNELDWVSEFIPSLL